MLLYTSIFYSKVLSEKSGAARTRSRPFHTRCAPSLFQWIPKLCLNIHRRRRVILVILNSGYRADVRISRRRSIPGPDGKSARNISLQKRFSLSLSRWPASNGSARSLPHSFYLGSIARVTYIFIRLSGWMSPVKQFQLCLEALSLLTPTRVQLLRRIA